MNTTNNVFSHLHALRLLIAKELSGKYKGTMLGFLWLFLQPLIMVLVYSFVFSVIMKVRVSGMENPYHFSLYLMAAMMPYTAFQEAILSASNSLFANSSLLHKSTLPPLLLPLVPILSTVVTEVVTLLIIIIATYFFLGQFSYYLLMLPFLVFVRLVLSLAIGYIVAILSVFIQDLRQALGLILTMLMFLTPIIYPVEMIPAEFVIFNDFNPLFHLFDGYRALIIRGEMPGGGLYFTAGFSLILLFFSVLFYQKTIERAKEFV
ncbi:MAG: ABC transporter permease [Methylococcales bacterium]|nr:ABC transporter permease [Methylococcales bacterium]